MGLKLFVKQVMKMTGNTQGAVLNWIDRGYLKAVKIGDNRNSAWIIDEDDLYQFMLSDEFPGNPNDIRSSRPFTRIPEIERCFPVNLASAMLGVRLDTDGDDMPYNIWQIDFARLKELVTHLTEREQKVIEMRFHLGMTFDECASSFKLTRERIRQIEAKALRKLRTAVHKEQCYVVSQQKYFEAKKRIEFLEARVAELEKLIPEVGSETEETEKKRLIEKLETPIEELDLSVRSYNCLQRRFQEAYRGVTVNRLINYDRNQHMYVQDKDGKRYYSQTWYNIRNLGRKSLEEIASKIFAFCGYRIRQFDTTQGTYVGFIDIPGVPQTLTKLEEVPS